MQRKEFDCKFVDAWVALWNNYDLLMVEKLFLNDERVTYFSSEKQGCVKGIKELIKHHEGFGFVRGGKSQPNKLWLEDIDIEDFPGVALVTAIWFFKRGGSENVQKGPVSLVYVPVSGEWRIAHANFGNY